MMQNNIKELTYDSASSNLAELLTAKEELYNHLKYNKILRYFPDDGMCARHLYKKHLEFFRAGKYHKLRAFIAANRVGKSESAGGYELVCHLTGVYPKWWEGYKFDKPIKSCISGKTNTSVRDTLQLKFLGPLDDIGCGLIPKKYIKSYGLKRGTPGAVEYVEVININGGISRLDCKSYEQGVKAFEGFEADCILLDEEPPEDIYGESLIRLMIDKGLLMITFTPFFGISNVVLSFLEDGIKEIQASEPNSTKYTVIAGWDDVPHLTQEMKKEMIKVIPSYQIDARTKGIPRLGAGAIYPIPEEQILVEPFEIPDFWPRGYALDVGWNCTAALWCALDRESETFYFYNEYKSGREEPVIHSQAIKLRGDWMTGAIDPASNGRSQNDGSQLIQLYRNNGLKLMPANNSVEAGIFDVYESLSCGKIKVFKTLNQFLEEYRLYRRDNNGKIVKVRDHLMDCMRYLKRTPQVMRTNNSISLNKLNPEYVFARAQKIV